MKKNISKWECHVIISYAWHSFLMNGNTVYNKRKDKKLSMKGLIEQVLRFGVVGFFCFLIDFGITAGLANIFGVHYLISKFLGFVISAVVNYILSIKFVFTAKKDMDKSKEFTGFIILSAIGLLINEIVMFVCIDGIYRHMPVLQNIISDEWMVSISSVIATGIVMIYNFISRKIFLERK